MASYNANETGLPTISAAERFRFDNDGYLVLHHLLSTEHVSKLLQAADRAVPRRRKCIEQGLAITGLTDLRDPDSRLFYILDDDPLFLELLDYPAIMPYVTGLLNERPHHHASDLIIENPKPGRPMGWHLVCLSI